MLHLSRFSALKVCICLTSLGLTLAWPTTAQTLHPPSDPPEHWMQIAADREVHIIDDDGSFPIQYITRKIDNHGDTTRATIESHDGAVARMVLRDGRPLTPEEDSAERARLQEILDNPSDWQKKQKRNTSARGYATDLVKLMPQAMICTYTPGQPQAPNTSAPQVVLDFKPDPNFRPPTTISQLLTGIEGRVWIDRNTGVMTRVEGRVVRPVNFGWGVLAHIYPGGTVAFEQTQAGKDRWIYSHLDEDITIREMMIKTVNEHSKMSAAEIHLLPAPISFRQAIQQLLAMPLPK